MDEHRLCLKKRRSSSLFTVMLGWGDPFTRKVQSLYLRRKPCDCGHFVTLQLGAEGVEVGGRQSPRCCSCDMELPAALQVRTRNETVKKKGRTSPSGTAKRRCRELRVIDTSGTVEQYRKEGSNLRVHPLGRKRRPFPGMVTIREQPRER